MPPSQEETFLKGTMPPSQEETFLKGKDTTNTNFDHDISYNDPSAASKTSEPPIDKTKKNNKASFLKLPVEIRFLIYDLLEVGMMDPGSYTRMCRPGTMWWEGLFKPDMEVGILQTCRQIYHETNPILYSKNEFMFEDPEKALRFIEQIGPVNLRLIKYLYIFMSHMEGYPEDSGTMLDTTAESPILRVFDILADEGHGICDIDYGWNYYTDDKHPKNYDYRRDTKLDIRTLEIIQEKIQARCQGRKCVCLHIKYRGNTRPSLVVEASARSDAAKQRDGIRSHGS